MGPDPPALEVISSTCEIERGLEGLRRALEDPRCAPLRGELLSFPPPDPETGRALVALLGPEQLQDVPQLGVLGVTWFADQPLDGASQAELSMRALGEARCLGSFAGLVVDGEGAALRALAALDRYRQAAAEGCEDCSMEPGPLPGAGPGFRLPPSIQGERLARSAHSQPAGALGALVGSVRAGGDPPQAAWDQVGACGMAALELARVGRRAELSRMLNAAVDGPSATDRLAALYAASILEDPERWPAGPARQRAERLGLVQGASAGSR